MIHFMFAVRDSAAQAFNRPFFLPSQGLAIRSFCDEVKRVDPNNTMNAHPADFELFLLGEFNDDSGSFEILPSPKPLFRAVDVV